MVSKNGEPSAFDQGSSAGRDTPAITNPFAEGTAEHNNFEVGRRFGAANADKRQRPSPAAMKPDADEAEG